jgi:hypothetical protein
VIRRHVEVERVAVIVSACAAFLDLAGCSSNEGPEFREPLDASTDVPGVYFKIHDAEVASAIPLVCAHLCETEVQIPECFDPATCGDCINACNSRCVRGGGAGAGPCSYYYYYYVECAAYFGFISGCDADGGLESGCDDELDAVKECLLTMGGAVDGGVRDGSKP